jgi:hypothetical protein
MTARILTQVQRNGLGGQYVIEDPDLANNRIFIESAAFDTDNLRARPNEFYFGNNQELKEPTTNGSWYQNPYIITNGKHWHGSSWVRSDTHSAVVGHSEPWFASLDYERLPGKHSWQTKSGLINIGYYYSYSSYTGQQSIWNGYDMNNIAQFQLYNQSVNPIVFYEDPYAPNEWYCIMHYSVNQTTNPHSEGPSLGKLRITGAGPTFTRATNVLPARYAPNHLFFMGPNSDNSAMFVEVDGNHQGLTFWKLTSANFADSLYTWVHPGSPIWHYQFPSNIRHSSDTRKVFYQGGWEEQGGGVAASWDEYRNAFFHRIIWDPVSQTVDIKKCTVLYPEGKFHYNYQRTVRYEPTWANRYTATFYYKPHQFTINGRTFLTYMFLDRSPNNYSERPYYSRRELGNTWVTFEIGTGNNDDVLTYHSTYSWTPTRYYVRYALPINPIGNQLLCVKLDTVVTLTFDTDEGWVAHDEEQISARSLGQDSTGRIYITSSGANNYYDNTTGGYDNGLGNGYNLIWEYIPNSPIIIKATLLQNSYVYSGSPINSSINVTAKNALKDQLVVENIRLIIKGTNAVFTNGTNSIDITTSVTGPISVPFIITGAGQPTISAHKIT